MKPKDDFIYTVIAIFDNRISSIRAFFTISSAREAALKACRQMGRTNPEFVIDDNPYIVANCGDYHSVTITKAKLES